MYYHIVLSLCTIIVCHLNASSQISMYGMFVFQDALLQGEAGICSCDTTGPINSPKGEPGMNGTSIAGSKGEPGEPGAKGVPGISIKVRSCATQSCAFAVSAVIVKDYCSHMQYCCAALFLL